MSGRGRSVGSSTAPARHNAPPAKKRRTTARGKKPSARYQRILEDEVYEDHIQRMYSPATDSNISTRVLPLEVQKQRDGASFTFPTLHSMCLDLTATHFLTHVLPSREAFDQAQRTGSQSIPKRASKASRIVSRGIGGRPILDEETAAGADYVPSDDDERGARDDPVGIAAAAPHTRRSSARQRPTVSTMAASTEELQEMALGNSQMLKLLPPPTRLKLLRLLRAGCPQALTRQVIVTYFIHGLSEIELDSAMQLFSQRPQEINLVLRSVGPPSSAMPSPTSVPLRRLSLSGLTRASPEAISGLFLRCHHLEEVVLKGCVRVDAHCIAALLRHNAKHLRVLNANFTDIGPEGVEAAISQAPYLEVLKIADVTGLTDKVVPDVIMRASQAGQAAQPPFVPLAHLRSLKIRNTQMGDASLTALFGLLTKAESPLTRLDVGSISLTGHRADSLFHWLRCLAPMVRDSTDPSIHEVFNLRKMEKLNLSDTSSKFSTDSERLYALVIQATVAAADLILDGIIFGAIRDADARYPLPFKVLFDNFLKASASHHSDGSDDTISYSPNGVRLPKRLSLAATETHLRREDFFASNQNPDHDRSEWGPLIAHAQDVNLSVTDLSGLHMQPGDETQTCSWNIKSLQLRDSRINDDGLAVFAAKCPRLERVSLAGTAVTSEGVRNLLTKCPYLTSIDLTGCRGIPVRERRNVFEFLG